jgi:hypothetical protein
MSTGTAFMIVVLQQIKLIRTTAHGELGTGIEALKYRLKRVGHIEGKPPETKNPGNMGYSAWALP